VPRVTPSFRGLRPRSERSSAAARGASRKRDTACELLLRRELWKAGLRYRVDVATLPGRPDVVFPRQRVAVFCDGDFWHGRDLDARLTRLAEGHNAPYWVRKIQTNVERDRRVDAQLTGIGWTVLRLWDSEIRADPVAAAARVAFSVRAPRSMT
jgi:DNA mismatch endonuclease (patch repair protein)